MTACVLSIGTEITRGEITNTNASWLSEQLTRLGIEVTEIASIKDDRADIEGTLRRLSRDHTLLVSTGGLGPTTDDITTECVARVLDVPLQRDQTSLDALMTRLARFNRELTPSNAKQTDFPRGAAILANPNGTAPGFSVKLGRAEAFFMPGVPGEMKPMFDTHVTKVARRLVEGGLYQVRLKTFGSAESAVNDQLAGLEAAHDVVIGYRAHFPEIEVKVFAKRKTEADAERAAKAAAAEVRERLGDIIFAEGAVTYWGAVGTLLREQGLTLGTAESCTGGLIAELLTSESGSSDFFQGSIVSYANPVKTDVLHVPVKLLKEHGAVSAEVARAMAEGARKVLGVDIALSVTGIAGPGGGTESKPVGLVHFAVATDKATFDERIVFPFRDRTQIRLLAAYAGLRLLRRTLLAKP
jgi:nicotinamide-nucleotide amidase